MLKNLLIITVKKLTRNGRNIDMDISKLKKTIETAETVENLWKIGEKIFEKNDNAVCAVTYLIERAYVLGKKDTKKSSNVKSKSQADKNN